MPPLAHAKLSASGAHRWMECPGSVKLSEHYPETSSIYAEEGTLAHEAAEQLIGKGRVTAKHKKAIKAFYDEHKELAGSPEEMLETLTPYVEFVREEFAESQKADPAAVLLTEQRVDLSAWVPESFGTTDVAIVGGGTLKVIDLKYGKGVAVSAENNPQLRLYALGTVEMLYEVYDIEDVAMTIYQPRLDSVSTEIMSANDLLDWGEKDVAPAAELALSDDPPFAAGAWCQFCPARHDCRQRAEDNLAIESYRDKHVLSVEEIAEVLAKVDGLVRWAEDLKDGALTRALDGENFPGFKVVEGRSNRRYAAGDDEIVKACEAAGWERAFLFETKLLSVSALEKVMGKKQFAEVLGGLVEKPPGKPTLVSDTDKRPDIRLASALNDFEDE